MSGIVGSRLNCRGSGLVGSLGSDGQVLTSSGAGTSAVFEAAAGGFDVSSITGATALAEEPATTDEMILSDAGTLKRLDISHITGAPCIAVYEDSDQTIGNTTATLLTFDQTDKVIGGTWASNRWTPGVAGWYYVTIMIRWKNQVDSKIQSVRIYKNGSHWSERGFPQGYGYTGSGTKSQDIMAQNVMLLDADDYIEAYAYQDTGGDSDTQGDKNQFVAWRLAGAGIT
tara:strand:- start:2239 stop:2922 length:684 start_codon:yes stop_codon:yes gene_type:complete